MKIGIIGAGHIGLALAKLSTAAGHTVMISNSRGPETLADEAKTIGCLAGEREDAARFGELTVLTIPFRHVFALDHALLDGRIVIDTNNYYPERDGRIAALDDFRTTTSEMVAGHFPGARIVKAFNAILAGDLAASDHAFVGSGRRALPLAGEDRDAKAVVADLHRAFGFDMVDAGSLTESWRFERAKPAYCIPLNAVDLEAALMKAERTVELQHNSWHRGPPASA